jgi:hypothetical protein
MPTPQLLTLAGTNSEIAQHSSSCVRRVSILSHIIHADRHYIASAQLAGDSKIEHCKVTG